ncbi:hypothetical protein [Halobacillus sp. BAB-2008]|uniref:hypothetical protein n=1 Tax=Halobacillus sp. BAB-2008 TaxID=1246484 RepID=UPI0002A4EE3B|nr:hypothetical protein [Halobacillus sp. BAB-2008]ELK46007.1 hypothetical protein D479_12228 [Halobacillus sp. BAB-2008]
MLATMYKRREKLAALLSVILLAVLSVYVLWRPPGTAEQWLNIAVFALPLLFMGSMVVSSRQKYNKVKKVEVPESNNSLSEVDHLVLKGDAGWFPRLLIFEKNGAYLGGWKLDKAAWWVRPLILYRKSVLSFFPATFGFYSNTGERILSWSRKGFKDTVVTIYDRDGETLGSYIQKEFKSLVHIKGELRGTDGNKLLSVQVSGFSGDFNLVDEEGRCWADFYNGRFPHEYTELFRDIDNDIVGLSGQLREDEKQLVIGAVGFLFMERQQRNR